jgi:hypothetical protein
VAGGNLTEESCDLLRKKKNPQAISHLVDIIQIMQNTACPLLKDFLFFSSEQN